ncbi:MAG: SOS response-associated peptidase [Kiritimatiellae bacterium]|nr:SOS response-associated peptidase [Kiritimatiellia bacterium]
MCGRFTVTKLPKAWLDALGLGPVPNHKPRYNIAPSQNVLAAAHDVEEDRNLLRFFEWGLLPTWSKDPKVMNRPINARSETAAEKPSFRSAMRYRRCVLPSDGFFEWTGKGTSRRPHYFQHADNALFSFAGLWEEWESERGECIHSCTILTTQANALVAKVHNRMPVILDPDQAVAWLDPNQQNASAVQQYLTPYPAERMTVVPVSQHVNSPRHDDALCIAAEPELF